MEKSSVIHFAIIERLFHFCEEKNNNINNEPVANNIETVSRVFQLPIEFLFETLGISLHKLQLLYNWLTKIWHEYHSHLYYTNDIRVTSLIKNAKMEQKLQWILY